MNIIKLRSTPLIVLSDEARIKFNLTLRWNPVAFIENDYQDNGETIIDHATGLRWQKSGSELISRREIDAYVNQLNEEKYGGHDGWRLPTTDELISLIEPEMQSNELYLKKIFDKKQFKCWGADSHDGYMWNVYFNRKRIYYDNSVPHYVKAVRVEYS